MQYIPLLAIVGVFGIISGSFWFPGSKWAVLDGEIQPREAISSLIGDAVATRSYALIG